MEINTATIHSLVFFFLVLFYLFEQYLNSNKELKNTNNRKQIVEVRFEKVIYHKQVYM